MRNRPNILFLLSDEHSFRCFGGTPAALRDDVDTPNLDRLAAQSTVYADTYCQMPLCTPSRMCLLTGRTQQHCGAWSNNSVLRPELPTLPGVLAAAGYRTCLTGKMHFGGNRQFNGFQCRPYGDLTGATGHQWEPLLDDDRGGMRARTAKAGVTGIPESKLQEHVVAAESVAWLREHRHQKPQQPWFLCASFSRPHFPLTAPRRFFDRYFPERVGAPFVARGGDADDHPMTVGMRRGFQTDEISADEGRHARAAYLACVSYLDEVLGDLLACLSRSELLENTIIVYTSDHGEMAGEHGLWWKNSWHEASARVPLLISTPDQRRAGGGAVVTTPTSLADLFPTLCGHAQVTPPADLDGHDLNGTLPATRAVFCDALNPRWGAGTEFRMVRRGRFKYVRFRAAPSLLFDLEADPGEQHNLVTDPAHATTAAQLAAVADDLDFAAAADGLAADRRLHETYRLDLPRSSGNCYLMPDGRLIEADDTLYAPTVLTADPAASFSDWPS